MLRWTSVSRKEASLLTQQPVVTIRDTFDPIPCDDLDKENRSWTEKYVEQTRAKLEAERADTQADPRWIKYLEREVASYQELLDRFTA